VKLHAIYRSYRGENSKRRPPYYSKALALASFVRALGQVDAVDVTFVNDGPVEDDICRLMQPVGRIRTFHGLGPRGSYAKALALALECTADESDIVWLAEDDYLYRPDAFGELLATAGSIPWASYFALYSGEDAVRPPGWRDRGSAMVHGHEWSHAVSTTSTFGARLPALRRDRHLFRFAMYAAHAWDHQTCLAYQGYVPFRGRWLVQDPTERGRGSLQSRIKVVGATPLKVVVDAMAARRSRRPALLVAPRPALATHLELAFLAPGVDWDAEAEATAAWARPRGIAVPQPAQEARRNL
jgi:hypothetical protein